LKLIVPTISIVISNLYLNLIGFEVPGRPQPEPAGLGPPDHLIKEG
jgi:hypothetical protein